MVVLFVATNLPQVSVWLCVHQYSVCLNAFLCLISLHPSVCPSVYLFYQSHSLTVSVSEYPDLSFQLADYYQSAVGLPACLQFVWVSFRAVGCCFVSILSFVVPIAYLQALLIRPQVCYLRFLSAMLPKCMSSRLVDAHFTTIVLWFPNKSPCLG